LVFREVENSESRSLQFSNQENLAKNSVRRELPGPDPRINGNAVFHKPQLAFNEVRERPVVLAVVHRTHKVEVARPDPGYPILADGASAIGVPSEHSSRDLYPRLQPPYLCGNGTYQTGNLVHPEVEVGFPQRSFSHLLGPVAYWTADNGFETATAPFAIAVFSAWVPDVIEMDSVHLVLSDYLKHAFYFQAKVIGVRGAKPVMLLPAEVFLEAVFGTHPSHEFRWCRGKIPVDLPNVDFDAVLMACLDTLVNLVTKLAVSTTLGEGFAREVGKSAP